MAPTKRSKGAPPPLQPEVIETYSKPYNINRQDEPTCFNGIVRIRRYRITIEMIEEPVEVLRDRLRKLWRETEYNTHTRHPMLEKARELGMDPGELTFDDFGIDHPKGRR